MKWLLILIVAFFIGFNAQVGYKLHEIYQMASREVVLYSALAISNFIIGGLFIAFLLKHLDRDKEGG